MPRNGSGTFNRIHDWTDDANNNIDIEADRMDEDTDDIADGLTQSISKDGQTNPTANLPMSGFIHTGVGNASARSHYAVVGQIQDNRYVWIAAGGTANAITATYSPAVTALVDGMELKFRATAANSTTTPTFSPNGLTARTITKAGGAALAVGDIPAALAECTVRYNLANTRWELINPSVSAPFVDSTALVMGSSDATKLFRIEVDGNTAGTTRVMTTPDADFVAAGRNIANTFSASQTFSNAINLTSGQIAFPATASPSADPNTLDDYEEGAVTASGIALTFATPGNLAVTYSTRDVTYTKIGNMVRLRGLIVTSAFTHTSASGTFSITGAVPFTPAKDAMGSVLLENGSGTAGGLIAYVNTSGQVLIYQSGTGSRTALTHSNFPTGTNKEIYFTVTFEV